MHIHKKLLTGACPVLAAGLATFSMTDHASARRAVGDPVQDTISVDAPITAPKTFALETATIKDIQTAMTEGSLTSVELVNLYLRRIQAYDKASSVSPVQPLNSVLALNPDLLEDAAQADRLRKQGIILGPLHGIPFLVKGSYPIIGMALTGGTTGWANLTVYNDAWSVAKMRRAGGIVMGHANMDTWASSASSSTSQIKGTVRSSYLQGALPGGSSGGSGVSSGAYLTAFAFGGETGGSIRHPSDRNGLVGYKVSGGSISVNGIIPLAPDRDVIGPMTRNAVDNAIIRDIVGVVDPDDLWTPVHQYLNKKRPVPETGFVSAVQGATLRGKKIGIIGTYVGMTHPDPGVGATAETSAVQTTTPETTVLVQQAKLDMEAAGATVQYVFMPPPVSTTYPLPVGSPRLLLDRNSGNNYERNTAYVMRSVIELAIGKPNEPYNELAPRVLQTASLVSSYISATRRGMFYNLDSSTGNYSPGSAVGFDSPEGAEHFSARAIHHNQFETWMDSLGLDAVVWPVFANKSRTGGSTLGRDLANIMNLPSVTVPMGKLPQPATSTLAAGVEPLTLNVTGRFFDDQKILGIAYAYQEVTKHRFSPPLAPPIAGEVFDFKRQSAKPYSTDSKPPVLTAATTVTYDRGGSVTFTGSVADAGGIDRLEVSVAGALIPATVEGNTWKALLPASSAANAFIANAAVVDIVVLAVDPAGNATTKTADVTL